MGFLRRTYVNGQQVSERELDSRRKSYRTVRDAIRDVEGNPGNPVPPQERLERDTGESSGPRRTRRWKRG
jgi:hypothetical protein